MASTDISPATLRELLDYNPETGKLYWRRDLRRCSRISVYGGLGTVAMLALKL